MSGPAAELLWPVGEPERERHGNGLPAGWTISIGFDREYWLGIHTGLDLDLPGESDYGAACYAVADGTVTHVGRLPGTWGKVILLEHRNVAGFPKLWSQYAHMARTEVALGQRIRQGQRIGTVGNAEGQLSAHLHFELRRSDLPAGRWPSGRSRSKSAETHAYIRQHYVDPRPLLGL